MSLEQTIGNLEIRYANVVTFVGTSNTVVDTTTGRIQTKGIQHNSNVITDISGPHGRVAPTLKKYPEIIFEEGKFDRNDTTNTYVQAGYTVTASSQQSTQQAWEAFDKNTAAANCWTSQDGTYYDGTSPVNSYTGTTHQLGTGAVYGEWLKLELPTKIKVSKFILKAGTTDEAPKSYKIYGSVLGSSWTELKDISNETPSISGNSHDVTDTTAYKHIAIVVTQVNTDQDNIRIGELEYYGYEEDPPLGDHSVDTTFMSRFNNPQLTGVKVLVDGGMANPGTNQISGGADPSGNSSTYDATNKYYTLNGTLTSNLSVEANTFLEGDQPHAVSVWFNSSNLEANVSNTCVFSISDQEKLDSQNLDLQSNTWHNLTYTYQGEGGSRVTYLDGRTVAEDQADDTFGDYPPFAMTGYSQSGYVVSARTELDTSNNAVKAFDNNTGTGYKPVVSAYDSSGNLDSGGTFAISASATTPGEWIKLKMPYELVVSYLFIQSIATSTGPSDFKLFGSNDDVNWDELLSITGQTTATTGTSNTVNVSKGYKYLAVVVTKTLSSVDLQIGELKFYGHKENDLIRLPDPTNVLEYPHIAMTGPAQRGYVATTDDQDATYPVWKAFDNNYWVSGADVERWQPSASLYGTAGADITGGAVTTLADTSTKRGNYIQLESPHKLNVTKYKIYSSTSQTTSRPKKVLLLGSNTGGTDWVSIDPAGEVVLTYSGSGADLHGTVSFSNVSAYKYHRLIVRATLSSATPIIFQFQLYGTGIGSIPVQIGGGNIDTIANFRVYDKFIQQDQALEIWNAQKDYFGRAKSQMVLQQGKLGIGTTGPTTTLDVVGGARITEGITSTTSLVSNAMTIGTTKTFVVTVQQVSGSNKYFIDGVQQASLTLHQHQTYIFDLSSSTLATHPFIFSDANTNDGNANGTPYTTGITTTGTTRTFIVPTNAPTTLYYYCTQHTGMGGTITISSDAELIVTGNVVINQNLIVNGSIQSSPIIISLSKTSVRTADVVSVTGLYFNSSLSLQLLGQDGTSLFSVTDYTFVSDTGLTFKIGSPNAAQIAQSPYKIRITTGNGTIVDSSLTFTYDPSLYDFTSHTFTTASQVGREGAAISVYKAAYSSAAWAQTDYFALGGSAGNNSYDGFQEWTVPKTATYTINAYGARGGDATSSNSTKAAGGTQTPGKGAHVSATFALTVGTKIVIICGHEGMPQTGDTNGSNGGGGGTWVLTENFIQTTDSLYMVAGGGTGTSEYGNMPASEAFANAIGNVQGTDSSGGAGGGNGSGGGGGFWGDGTAAPVAGNGKKPYNGALGGFNSQIPSYAGGDGGFGGGGAQQDQSPGGGGGYRGGRGSYFSGASGYHGSQSYIMLSGAGGVTVTNRAFNGNHTGATGYVSIVKNN